MLIAVVFERHVRMVILVRVPYYYLVAVWNCMICDVR